MKKYIQSQAFQEQIHHMADHAFFKPGHGDERDNLYFVKQVHSNRVINYSDFPHIKVEADAIVSNDTDIDVTLAVITADCVPVILVDLHANVIAIAHAGWKGARIGIIENTLEKMSQLGAQSQNIVAAIGPCIRQPSYEVTEQFYHDFFPDDHVFFMPSKEEGHLMFDLCGYVKNKLSIIKAVYDCEVDTYTDKSFASYRRRSAIQNVSIIRFHDSLQGLNTWKKSFNSIKKNNQNKKIHHTNFPTIHQVVKHSQHQVHEPILDLHGYTQELAYQELNSFIKQQYESDSRAILVITGKGSGIIRESVHKWLKYSNISQYILKFECAKPQDGGSGALYVRLKKNNKI